VASSRTKPRTTAARFGAIPLPHRKLVAAAKSYGFVTSIAGAWGGFEHPELSWTTPVASEHESTVHAMPSSTVTLPCETHAPAEQVATAHRLPPSHEVPSVKGVCVSTPPGQLSAVHEFRSFAVHRITAAE
jgi:hypothetical protein